MRLLEHHCHTEPDITIELMFRVIRFRPVHSPDIEAGSLGAQQREAVLTKVEVPNANFDIILAIAKPGGSTFDPRTQPDAYFGGIVHLGSALVHTFSDKLFKLFRISATCSARLATCKFKGSKVRTPVVVYVVPKPE